VEIRERKIGKIPYDIENDAKKRALAEAQRAKAELATAAARAQIDKEAIARKARELADQKKDEAMKTIIELKRSAEREEAESLKRVEVERREAEREIEARIRERQRERDRDARQREERKRDEQREERDRERPNRGS
jgi:colicin import membrane protein